MPAPTWRPQLDDSKDALYVRIVAALESDIRLGALSGGDRLPPQRWLADQLKVSVGTVTKAYLEAERRGLVGAHVGRGTFVAAADSQRTPGEGGRDAVVDLAMNIVPHQAAAQRMLSAWSPSKRHFDLLESLAYVPAAGAETHRRAAVSWLARIAHLDTDWTRLLVTAGAQHGMSLAFGSVCRAGDAVLCEAATFFGMKRLAEHCDYRLHGVEIDAQGLVPDALERAIKSTGATTLYTMPTVQNPTGRTMGSHRREEIAKIVRRHNLWVVEDDTYALFAPTTRLGLEPLAAIVPERCFYLASVSKSLAPGLRVGFLQCPTALHFDAATAAIKATLYAPPALGGVFFTRWVSDGSAFEIAATVRAEIERRATLAKEILGSDFADEIRLAPHFWIEMPELEAERTAGRALRAGVAVTPPSAVVVRPDLISGLRVCLGAATDMVDLRLGLERLRAALQRDLSVQESAMV